MKGVDSVSLRSGLLHHRGLNVGWLLVCRVAGWVHGPSRLVQSADKLLIDISKKSGRTLKHDWVEFIKPEKLDFFFRTYRKTYNFFKHADHDFGQDLPVHDITGFNIIALFVAIQNYHALFGSYTGHMAFHNMFVQAVMPGIFRVEMNPQQAVA